MVHVYLLGLSFVVGKRFVPVNEATANSGQRSYHTEFAAWKGPDSALYSPSYICVCRNTWLFDHATEVQKKTRKSSDFSVEISCGRGGFGG